MEFEITPEEVQALRKGGGSFKLLDVRQPWEFDAAKIEGSVLIPMSELPTRAEQELDPEEHIVVVCHHGVRSASVTNWLREQGFEKSQSMRGGIDAWARVIDTTVPIY